MRFYAQGTHRRPSFVVRRRDSPYRSAGSGTCEAGSDDATALGRKRRGRGRASTESGDALLAVGCACGLLRATPLAGSSACSVLDGGCPSLHSNTADFGSGGGSCSTYG